MKSAFVTLLCVLALSPRALAQDEPEAIPDPAEATSADVVEPSGGVVAELEARVAELEAEQAESEEGAEENHDEGEELRDSLFEQLAHRVAISGYSTSYFRSSSSRGSSFRAFRLALLIDGRITDRLRFYAELKLQDAARIGEGEGTLELEQAFMEFAFGRSLMLRAGALLVPFGYYNRLHEGWRQLFTRSPLINDVIFPSTYADVGLEAHGLLLESGETRLIYDVAMINGLGDGIATEGEGVGLRETRPSFKLDPNASPAFVGHLRLMVSDVFELNGSGYYGRYATQGRAAIAMGGIDSIVHLGPWSLRLEGVYIHIQPGGRLIDEDEDPSTPPVFAPFARNLRGFVAETELRFWPSALSDTFLGDFEDPTFFVAARFDAVEQGFETPKSEIVASAAIGYRPVHRSAIRLEFAQGRGDLRLGNGWEATLAFAMGY
ncbi:MAG: hypothetical protein GXP55_22020 [Deltaproteobacteria bacterium]|nr:hypothetical protein [Deltaproteobacteria bacterium]